MLRNGKLKFNQVLRDNNHKKDGDICDLEELRSEKIVSLKKNKNLVFKIFFIENSKSRMGCRTSGIFIKNWPA